MRNIFPPIVSFLIFIATTPLSAQWTQTNGPYGGTIRALAVNGPNLFAATEQGRGVYRSTDDGVSWTQSGLSPLSVSSLAVNGPSLFAGGGSFSGSFVYRSTDNGSTWDLAGTGLPGSSGVRCFAVSDTNLFAGTHGGGIYRSTDNGTTWNASNAGVTNNDVNALVVSGENLIAGTNGGIFLSTNNGDLWTSVNPELTTSPVNAFAVRDSFAFAGVGSGLLRSSDYGASWLAGGVGLPPETINALAVSGDAVLLGSSKGWGVFRSTDDGATWFPSNAGMTNEFYVLSFAGDDSNLFAGLDYAGVCRSTDDGLTWSGAGAGLPVSGVVSLASNGGNVYAGTVGNGVVITTDNGSEWTAINSGYLTNTDEFPIGYILLATDSLLLVSMKGVGLARSTNNGAGWTSGNSGLSGGPDCIAADSSGNLFAGTNQGAFLSTDNGMSWTAVNAGLPVTHIVISLAVLGTNVFAGVENFGVYRSIDAGANWTPANSGIATSRISTIAITGTTLIAGTPADGAYSSADSGANWTPANAGLTDGHINALTPGGANVFIGTRHGVSLSTNKGATWVSVNAGLTDTMIYALTILGSNLYAGTVNGVWRGSLSQLAGVSLQVRSNWNMVSVPVDVPDTSISTLFPSAISSAYAYAGTYTTNTELTSGVGYWMKFPADESVPLFGMPIPLDSITVSAGWNLIGSISTPVSAAQVTSDPGGMVTSQFFGYEGAYVSSDTIQPGRAYWVKADQSGTLVLAPPTGIAGTTRPIRIVPTEEAPPAMPDGDRRDSESPVPDHFVLDQNYPNPFNPTTNIHFSIPKTHFTTLRVFDVLGRVVATLVDELKPAGTYEITFDAGGLSSGVYYYSLRAGAFSETKKLVLFK